MSSERAFLGTSALLFLASAGFTVSACASMGGGMPMPGGWNMSMAWMRMPGQTWLGAAASFMAMWIVMMMAMMLPSLASMLSDYRRCLGPDVGGLGRLTALAGAGYFFVWAVFGAAAYPLGVAVAAAEMKWPAFARSVPLATGAVLVLAGCVQLTAWKARHLGRCRDARACGAAPSPDARSAWRHGLRLGRHCSLCCSGLIVGLLVTGVMDLRAMALVTAAITAERLVPRPERVARATGLLLVATGGLEIVRSLGAA